LARRPAPGILLSMDTERLPLAPLSREECLALMASVSLGRIIFTRRALPAVELVCFALDNADIVIAAGALAAVTHGAVVAFQADDLDPVSRVGWTVTAIGQSREVTEQHEIDRLLQVGLGVWPPGEREREHFIRISPGILTGSRLQGL
jgi:uncharacterized protein